MIVSDSQFPHFQTDPWLDSGGLWRPKASGVRCWDFMVDEELPASRASVLLKLKLCAIESILNVCLKNKAPQFQGGFVIILAILAGHLGNFGGISHFLEHDKIDKAKPM